MFKRLLLLSIAALLCLTASAQFNYVFKDTTTPYAPLTGATSLNGGNIWFGDNFQAPVPFTWKLDSTIVLNKLGVVTQLATACADTADFSDVNGFMFADVTLLVDRGALGFTSLSPIRYRTTGTSPSRIFKMELFNAGFGNEYFNNGTLNDSICVQIWIYETSNIVELHYGPSRINTPGDYFASGGAAPLIGYIKHADFFNGTAGDLYYIKGNSPTATAIDSFNINAANLPANILSSWPASGRVFRFTPKKPLCAKPVSSFTASAPVGRLVAFTYTGTTPALDSIVWDFGDGIKQTIVGSYTTPITHTYATAGRYTVTVTAYNVCGNNVSTSIQNSVSVGSIASLGNVKVYPNPATNLLTIAGLAAGSTASILSVVGQTVLRADIRSGRETINISSLPAGTYTLLLTTADGASGAMRFTRQ